LGRSTVTQCHLAAPCSTAATITPSWTRQAACEVLTHSSKFKEISEVTHTAAISKPKIETLQIESTPTATILFPLT